MTPDYPDVCVINLKWREWVHQFENYVVIDIDFNSLFLK
jgi:hypothetical protein